MRLSGSWNGNDGILEVHYHGMWGKVGDDPGEWTDEDATVACRELGYIHGLGFQGDYYYNRMTTIPIWMYNVRCSGEEMSLRECEYEGLIHGNYLAPTYQVFVVCYDETDQEGKNCNHLLKICCIFNFCAKMLLQCISIRH